MALPSERESLNRLVGFAATANKRRKNQAKTPTTVNSDPSAIQVQSFEEAMNVAMTAIIGGPSHVAKDFSTLQSLAKSPNNIYGIINSQKDIVNNINETLKVVSSDIKSVIENINDISIQTQFLEGIAESIDIIVEKLNKKKDKGDKVQLIQLAAGDANVGNLLKSLQDFDEKSLEKVEKIVTELNKLNSIDLSKFKENIQVLDDDVIKNLADKFDGIKNLYENHVAGAADAAAKGEKDLETISKTNEKITEVVVEGKKPDKKQLQEAKTTYEGLASTILAGAFAMIIGALIIKAMPDFPELALKFVGVFTLFLSAILVPLVLSQLIISKYGGDKGKDDMEEIAGLIAVCAFVMIIGALFMKIPGLAESALAFSKQLAVFFILTIGALGLVSRLARPELLEQVKNLGNLIVLSAFVMVIGAFFMKIDWLPKNALLFGLTLGLFVATILVPFILMSWIGGNKKFVDNIKGVSNLIVTCTIVMMIGALFMLLDNGTFVKNALKFGVVLSLFIALVILPFIILKPLIGMAEHTINDVTRLIVVCTIVMMVGALFVLLGDGKFVTAALKFTVVLSLFITGCVLPILILKPFLIAGLQMLKSLSLFVLVSAGVLFVGAYFVRKGYAADALLFTVVFGAYLLAMIGIFSLLGVAAALVGPGAAVAAAMGLALMALAGGFALISIIAETYKDTLNENLTTISGWIWDIGLLFSKIGLLSPLILIGGIVVALMTPVLTALSLVLLLMTVTANQVAKIPDVSSAVGKIKGFFTLIDGFPSGFKLLKMTLRVMAVTPLALLMSGALLTMSLAIAAIANLRVIEEWDNNGKPKRYRNLSESDFTNASRNVATVITTLADALINVYNLRPDLFNTGSNSVIFTVLQASKEMGGVISNIAEGLQLYANLMIPDKWNDEGKPIHFSKFGTEDFKNAARGIHLIISTLGQSILDFIDQNPVLVGYMEETRGGFLNLSKSPSKFAVVCVAGKQIGDLIGGIAQGLTAYANMMYPVHWNKDGHPDKFESMTDTMIVQAKLRIVDILTDMTIAISEAYDKINNSGGFFSGIFGNPSKVKEKIECFTSVGSIISDIAEGLLKYAALMIPDKWNNEGKAIHYKKLPETFFEDATEKIETIMLTTALSLENVYYNHKELFDGENPTIKKVIDLGIALGNVINGVSTGLSAYANLVIPIHWNKEGNPDKFRAMIKDDIEKAKSNIALLIVSLSDALILAYEDPSKLGIKITSSHTSPVQYLTSSEGMKKLESVTDLTGTIIDLVAGVCEMVSNIAELKIPTGFTKDGKAKGYKKLNETSINEMKENIGMLLVSIPEAVVLNCIEGENARWFNGLLQEKENDIVGTLNSAGNVIGAVLNNAELLIGSESVDLIKNVFAYKKQSKVTPFDIYTSMSDLFFDVVVILEDFVMLSTYLEAKFSTPFASSIFTHAQELVNNEGGLLKTILNYSSQLDDYSEVIIKIHSLSLNGVKSDGTVLPMFIALNNLINGFGYIHKNITDEDTLALTTNFDKKTYFKFGDLISMVGLTIDKAAAQAISISKNIDEIVYADLSTERLNNIATTINNIKSVRLMLNDALDDNIIVGKETYKKLWFNFEKTTYTNVDSSKLLENIILLNDIIEKFVNTTKAAEKISGEEFDNFGKAIYDINYYVKFIDDYSVRRFDKEVEATEKFVKAIGSVKVGNARAITQLLEQMARLSEHMGDLDKFTKVLSEQLSSTLMELTKQIRDAQRTIKDADRIQRQRHELIDNSIAKVQKMMESTLQVNVTSTTNGSETTTDVTEETR